MRTRREIVDTIMTEWESMAMCPRQQFWGEPSITVAGVEITSEEVILRYQRMNLEERLPAVETFKTCEDFPHLDAHGDHANGRCCDACHGPYEIYEMSVVPLPEGGYAWVCCAMDRAIRPEWHRVRNERFAKTARGKLWNRIFKERG